MSPEQVESPSPAMAGVTRLDQRSICSDPPQDHLVTWLAFCTKRDDRRFGSLLVLFLDRCLKRAQLLCVQLFLDRCVFHAIVTGDFKNSVTGFVKSF
jgi:hypothetical protein